MTNESKMKKYVINLESDRLLLRNTEESDKDFIISLWTDSDVTKYMGDPREKSKMVEVVNEILSNPYAEEYDLWTLVEKTTNQPVGHCGLLLKDVEGKSEVEVIYVIDKSNWGKGYATEASQMLIKYAVHIKEFKKVIALIKPENKASEVVAIKNGMKLEKEVVRDNDTMMHLYIKER